MGLGLQTRLFLAVFLGFLGTVGLVFPAAGEEKGGTGQTEDKPLFALDASITSEAIYDTNIFQTTFNPVDDFYMTLQPRIGLHIWKGALGADLAYQPRFLFFTNNVQNDGLETIIQDLRFASVLYSNEYFSFEVKDTLDTTKTVFSNPDTPNNLSTQNRALARAIFTDEINPRLHLQASAEVERRDIEFPGEDYLQPGGNLNLRYEVNPILAFYGSETAHYTMYDDPTLGNVFSLSSEAGMELRLFERLLARGAAIYDYLFVPGPFDSGNLGWRANLDFEATQTTHLGFEARQTYGLDNTAHAVTSTNYNATVDQQLGPRTFFRGEAYLLHLDYQNPSFGVTNDRLWGVKAGFTYEITEKLRAGLRYEMDQNGGQTTFNDFTAQRGIFEVTYDFGKLINVF